MKRRAFITLLGRAAPLGRAQQPRQIGVMIACPREIRN
jgi:hypothetical protein